MTPTRVHGPSFTIIYDLRDEGALERANLARALWGKRYTEVHYMDKYHVALVFGPAPDPRWRAWEERRRAWISREAA